MIVGRKVAAFHLNHDHVGGETAVEVEGLTGKVADGVSFALRRGEVLGLTGLIGAGFDEIPALLAGATQAASGRLTFGDEAVALTEMTPRQALGFGVAYLPADRLAASGAGSLSVEENMALPSYETFRRGWSLNMTALRDWAQRLVAEHDVRPGRADLPLASLSGGNQQKALLAKWLETGPRLLLLDEPTQGVDVGARQQVYRALERAAQAGTTIICASTDLEQLAQICDRVLVFAKGRVSADLRGSAVTQEAIADACYRGGEARAA
jgi:ribose transport system ATP-binding protein